MGASAAAEKTESAPAKVEDPAKVDRWSIELRVAFITAVVALVVAVVGGGISIYESRTQSVNQSAEARAEYLRTQRTEAYASFIAAHRTLRNDYFAAAEIAAQFLLEDERYSDQALSDAIRKAHEDYDAMMLPAVGIIDVLGSADLRTKADDVASDRFDLIMETERMHKATLGTNPRVSTNEIYEENRTAYEMIDTQIEEFIALARAEVLLD